MGKTEKFVTLKLTSAVVVDGNIVRAGTLVEMMDSEAKDLLRRGKAVLATERDEPADTTDASDAASEGEQANTEEAAPNAAARTRRSR